MNHPPRTIYTLYFQVQKVLASLKLAKINIFQETGKMGVGEFVSQGLLV